MKKAIANQLNRLSGFVAGKHTISVWFNHNDNEHAGLHMVNPIPLTPEILEMYNFERCGEWFLDRLGNQARINISLTNKKTTIGANEEYPIEHIEFVHQLQNICLDLFKVELKFEK